MATKLQVVNPVAGRPGIDLCQDRMSQSQLFDYVGATGYLAALAKVALTAAYQDAFAFNAAIDAVLDLFNYDSFFIIADYTKSAGTDCRIKVSFGVVNDRTKCLLQEVRDDNGFPGVVKHEVVEHVLSATGVYLIAIPRMTRYAKIEAKSSGAPDANDKIALTVFGQNGV